MILQVLSDARQFMPDRDAEVAQEGTGTDAGELEKLRRTDGAGREDYFTAAAHRRLPSFAADGVGDTGCGSRAGLVEQQTLRQCAGDDLQVPAGAYRLEIGCGGRAAPAVARRQLEIAGALLPAPVEIVVARNAEFFRRGNQGFADVAPGAHVRDGERPADTVERVGAALLILGAAEIWQNFVV